MAKFTIEATYRMPYYRHRTYDAATPEEACRLAIEDEDWSTELPDYECAGATYVAGVWNGTDTAYEGEEIVVPSHFQETTQRMVDHFHVLFELLVRSARPMGLSRVEFEHWLPKAVAAIEKARAIIEERRDPDEPGLPHDEASS